MIQSLLHNKYIRIAGILAIIFIGAILCIVILSFAVIDPSKQYILTDKNSTGKADVGLVLGAGITPKGKPYKELAARLDVAAEAMQKGYVKKLIVSGDNRFDDYDEPTAMKEYLVKKYNIDPDKIQPDFAGRSTYELCERASKIFEQKKLVIISAESHLPRAIYLCRHFGIESYGLASTLEANNSTRRETLARVKALYNVYIHGEPTILGQSISL